uniref:BES1/BZR1 plant transcription factor N-terminal domain-containing protein n=1 Tax=Picea sitchensis TaxID=3332 RepID=D5AE36_PICSI|nr:unknown [Picea sitchensis]
MTSGGRLPTSKERENNKRRERRRRAIAARIFAGLRLYGNYKLPKHCDNNEVLKALCAEAGWIVDQDGTTYRPGTHGCTRISEREDCGISSSPSAVAATYQSGNGSLIPWLKGLGSNRLATQRALPPLQIITGGSCSAPVTPPLTSPTVKPPYRKSVWDAVNLRSDSSALWSFQATSSMGHSNCESGFSVQGAQDVRSNAATEYANNLMASENVEISPTSIQGNENGATFTFGPLNPINEGLTSTAAWKTVGTVMHGVEAEHEKISSGVRAWEGEKIHHMRPEELELELTLGSSSREASARPT